MKIRVNQFKADVELVTKLKIINNIFLTIFRDELNDGYVSDLIDEISQKLQELTDYVNEIYLKAGKE